MRHCGDKNLNRNYPPGTVVHTGCGIELNDENWYKHSQKRKEAFCKDCYKLIHYNHLKLLRSNKRNLVLTKLGGKCECCGESNFDFLSVDHIDGAGGKERKSGLRYDKLYAAIIKDKYKNIENLRLLCFNCNYALGAYGFCAHNQENSNACFICNDELVECDVGKTRHIGPYRSRITGNHHPFFKESKINVCFDCALKHKLKIPLISERKRNARMSVLNRRYYVINGYNGKCECCGESSPLFLTVDHINYHDGLKSFELYIYLIKNNFPTQNHRILCYNCNCGRARPQQNGICPHKSVLKIAV